MFCYTLSKGAYAARNLRYASRRLRFAALALAAFCGWGKAGAQTITAAEAFKTMPDSIIPYLTKNNRLDLVDFMEAGMKAEVTNRFDGTSTLSDLTDKKLTLKASPVLTVVIGIFDEKDNKTDSVRQVIQLKKIWTAAPGKTDEQTTHYTTGWAPLSGHHLPAKEQTVNSKP